MVTINVYLKQLKQLYKLQVWMHAFYTIYRAGRSPIIVNDFE